MFRLRFINAPLPVIVWMMIELLAVLWTQLGGRGSPYRPAALPVMQVAGVAVQQLLCIILCIILPDCTNSNVAGLPSCIILQPLS
jgi:hypothetical protein